MTRFVGFSFSATVDLPVHGSVQVYMACRTDSTMESLRGGSSVSYIIDRCELVDLGLAVDPELLNTAAIVDAMEPDATDAAYRALLDEHIAAREDAADARGGR